MYGIDNWGENYFSINSAGNVTVSPKSDRGQTLDLMALVEELDSRNLKLPLLIHINATGNAFIEAPQAVQRSDRRALLRMATVSWLSAAGRSLPKTR